MPVQHARAHSTRVGYFRRPIMLAGPHLVEVCYIHSLRSESKIDEQFITNLKASSAEQPWPNFGLGDLILSPFRGTQVFELIMDHCRKGHSSLIPGFRVSRNRCGHVLGRGPNLSGRQDKTPRRTAFALSYHQRYLVGVGFVVGRDAIG